MSKRARNILDLCENKSKDNQDECQHYDDSLESPCPSVCSNFTEIYESIFNRAQNGPRCRRNLFHDANTKGSMEAATTVSVQEDNIMTVSSDVGKQQRSTDIQLAEEDELVIRDSEQDLEAFTPKNERNNAICVENDTTEAATILDMQENAPIAILCDAGNFSAEVDKVVIEDYDDPSVVIVGLRPIDSSEVTPPTSSGKRRKTPKDTPGRKRRRNKPNWKDAKAKAARLAGEQYVNRAGKTVPAKEMKEACGNDCKFKCRAKIANEDRCAIFKQFYVITTHERKWDFIARHIRVVPVARSTTNWKSRRSNTRCYFFRIGNAEIRVCKTMFEATLGISGMYIETACAKMGSGGAISPDKRGKHTNKGGQRNVSPLKNSVREHINLFPRVPSHYCRNDSNREYLEENLSVPVMYSLYQEWMASQGRDKVATLRHYRDVFNEEFNLAFFKPKKDQCNACVRWDNSNDEEKKGLMSAHEQHMKNKTRAREEKDQDKENGKKDASMCVACFDLEKVLNAPHGKTSDLYYRRKLNVFNFTICDICTLQGYCYIWNESQGKKGSNEVGSCLYDFISTKVNEGVKNFVFWSDNCTGQNRNRYVFAMFLKAAVQFGVKITHKFLEVGHTQNEGDSIHSVIEKKSRNVTIYTPEEWIGVIKTARTGQKAYIVKEVSQDKIYDFKKMVCCQSWEKDSEGMKVQYMNIKQMEVDGAYTNVVKVKYSFDEEAKVIPVNSKRGRPLNLMTYQLPQAYDAMLPISKEKIDDLNYLCLVRTIPSSRHAFFKSLVGTNVDPD